MCFEAGLVWGEELFIDSTVRANAANGSLVPKFAVKERLDELFDEEPVGAGGTTEQADAFLPNANDEELYRS